MKKTTVYSTKNCPWCKKTKDFLKENKIKFKEVDITHNKKIQEELFKRSGQIATPIIGVEGKLVVGYDGPKIKKELGLK